MEGEKDIDALAEEYLDFWISHLSKLKLSPWDLTSDLISNGDPALEGLYRQWEAFYHRANNPDQFTELMTSGKPQAGKSEEGAALHDTRERPSKDPKGRDFGGGDLGGGDQGAKPREQSGSASISHDVSPDELTELKARLRALTKQISDLETPAGNPGKNETGDS